MAKFSIGRFIRKAKIAYYRSFRFITYDMWRLTDEELKSSQKLPVNSLKALYLAIRGFINDDLSSNASALTYSTVLSIVPFLAVIIGIAKGFGLQKVVYEGLINNIPSHVHELEKAFTYVENYLSQVQGGVFLGFGLIILLYTVISLVSTAEDSFNRIWQAPKSRPWSRKIVDYLSFFIIMPLAITVSSGLTLVMTTIQNTFFSDYIFFAPIWSFMFNLIPYLVIIFTFTTIYILLPNVKVKFMPAFISGIVAGIGFQIFQSLYIGGVLWISKYNAIYGSFAAFPLLLLWVQLSWMICLFGAQLSFSIQNVGNFAFEKSSENVSRRYLDFVAVIMAAQITKRFVNSVTPPHRVETIANECKVPMKMANRVIKLLLEIGVIVEVNYGDEDESGYYHPAIDPNKLSAGYVLDLIDRKGSEDFKIDRKDQFHREWNTILASRQGFVMPDAKILLKDL
ncbi:YihY/virulence factor BrkB family protein [Porphyromonas pogonae]|uniref:YihY/virulence factor BrkB family protein n=1 Tax=Porphyromonas pogonae TaxID=867595 RepID=UPI002E7661CF|nr:YihY/virulence factor BrkB family protein [Porphyromonas pogonae]